VVQGGVWDDQRANLHVASSLQGRSISLTAPGALAIGWIARQLESITKSSSKVIGSRPGTKGLVLEAARGMAAGIGISQCADLR